LQNVCLKRRQLVRLNQGVDPHRIKCRQIMGQTFDVLTAGTQVCGAAESKLLQRRGERL
jgi:hypothetical protein